MPKHQIIYVAPHLAQANVLVELLADEGIDAFVINETAHLARLEGGEHLLGIGGDVERGAGPCVVVRAEDADAALFIAQEAEDALRAGLEHLEAATPENDAWPECPSCGRPRLTSCPVCETSGSEFASAFLPDGDEDDDFEDDDPECDGAPRLVLCPTCDEPFAPRFLARCEWCGYRFAGRGEEGRRHASAAQASDYTALEFNGRAALLMAALALLAAAVVGWFYFVLRYPGG